MLLLLVGTTPPSNWCRGSVSTPPSPPSPRIIMIKINCGGNRDAHPRIVDKTVNRSKKTFSFGPKLLYAWLTEHDLWDHRISYLQTLWHRKLQTWPCPAQTHLPTPTLCVAQSIISIFQFLAFWEFAHKVFRISTWLGYITLIISI